MVNTNFIRDRIVAIKIGIVALIIHAMPKLNDQNWNVKYE